MWKNVRPLPANLQGVADQGEEGGGRVGYTPTHTHTQIQNHNKGNWGSSVSEFWTLGVLLWRAPRHNPGEFTQLK